MKKFILTIDLENDAFQPDEAPEIIRILETLTEKLTRNAGGFGSIHKYQNLLDVNGNVVGQYAIKYVERIRIDEDTTSPRK